MKRHEKKKSYQQGTLILFLLKKVWEFAPEYIPLKTIQTTFNACLPILTALLPGMILDELVARRDLDHVLGLILLAVLSAAVIALVNYLIGQKITKSAFVIDQKIELSLDQAFLKMPYENLEKPEMANLSQLARDTTNRASTLEHMVSNLFSIAGNLLSLGGLAVILLRLVATDWQTASVSGVVGVFAHGALVSLCIVGVLNILSSKFNGQINQVYYKFDQEFAATNRAYRYYGQLARDYRYGKDIRIFGIFDLIHTRLRTYLDTSKKLVYQANRYEVLYQVLSDICLALQLLLIYTVIGCKTLAGLISIGDLYTYAVAAMQLVTVVTAMIAAKNSVSRCLMYQRAYKEILELGIQDTAKNRQLNPGAEVKSIEFENVTFTYPGAETPVLKNVSLKISQGKKAAIVGRNGSGKTTLVKLLLGLYEPDEGRILVNGINLKDMDYEAYVNLCAAVFQDFKMLACSVEDNIALGQYGPGQEHDAERMDKLLDQNDLQGVLEKLPKGKETVVGRRFEGDGVEFSGGETQKIAIARAMYKQAGMFVLDEPTSALDPLAEQKFFQLVQQQLEQKTALFISHRLSSCCMCDEIFVLDGGKLVQYGPHKELLEKEGLYRRMWEAQAKYYT